MEGNAIITPSWSFMIFNALLINDSLTNGRTASWTQIKSDDLSTSSKPLYTDCCLVSPPATTFMALDNPNNLISS